jgi:hypothetical protein
LKLSAPKNKFAFFAARSIMPQGYGLVKGMLARVRDRPAQNRGTKGSLSPTTAKLMVFKLLRTPSKDLAAAERHKSVAEGHRRYQIPRRH